MGIMKRMVTPFKRSHACTATLMVYVALHPTTADPTSAGDSWTLRGKSGSASCGVTAPFSWVLVHTGSVCALQESVSQSCVSSGGSMVGLMATPSKRAYAIPRFAAPRAPVPAAVHC